MKTHQASFDFTNRVWDNLPNLEEWNSEDVLITVFCSRNLSRDPDIFKDLYSKFDQATMIGCSTSGEIIGDNVYDNSIVLTFVRFEDSKFKVFKAPILSVADSYDVGRGLADRLLAPDLKGIFVLSEGLNCNGSEIVKGLNSIIPANVVVGGGLAGDASNFELTFLVHNGEIMPNYLGAIGFYGEHLNVTSEAKGGWRIFGPERSITKSEGNILYEIDGKPALDLYKEYLGDKAQDLPSIGLFFPLQIYHPDNPKKKLVRTILNIDESSRSMIFAGNVPEGWIGQLMQGNAEDLIDASAAAYESAEPDGEWEREELILAVSCVGRRLVLGERCEEEVEAIKCMAPKTAKLAGFYSYGEISTDKNDNKSEFHNQTMCLFIITE